MPRVGTQKEAGDGGWGEWEVGEGEACVHTYIHV
jgi:hypothetical protein